MDNPKHTNGSVDYDHESWRQLVRAEFLEIPGLSLTDAQAQRLWGLDPHTCGTLLDEMVSARFLRRNHRNRYVRVD